MKKIILLLSLFIMWSCGTRKVDNYNNKQINDSKELTESKSGGEVSEKAEGESTYKTKLNDFNIQIGSKGKEYRINYNGLEFVGNADLTLSNKDQKEENKVKWVYKKHFTYYNVFKRYNITYQKWVTHHKTSESKRDSWWLYALIAALFFGGGFYMAIKFKQ
ncbi:hypothetical protein [Elizabethkingia meningoseptica]|uniref:hypothetical protein n=1 Tax=Elizabethkingia meningoseptica TaxID=238 RepID=UPI0023B0F826|nr:hypothetical protein [Elizabethkingia meningoseptica]MDE5526624.1 hypothetical protein [Elizabethkingia meningoseptica]